MSNLENGQGSTNETPIKDNTHYFLQIISKRPEYLKKIRGNDRTDEFIHNALISNPACLEYLTESEQTIDRCKFCVSHDGLLLRFVHNQTDKYDVIICALEQNYQALQYVHYQTVNLCEQVINAQPDAIRFVNIRDNGLYYLAMCKDPNNIKYIPEEYQTDNIKKLAYDKKINLDYVSNPTPEELANYIRNDPDAINNLPSLRKKFDYLNIKCGEKLDISYEKERKVLIHDVDADKMYYTNYTKDLLDMVWAFVVKTVGDRGRIAAQELFGRNKTDEMAVKDDPQFKIGLFIIEKGDKHYELWEKVNVDAPPSDPNSGWYYYIPTSLFSTGETKIIKKLRTYRLMFDITYQQYD